MMAVYVWIRGGDAVDVVCAEVVEHCCSITSAILGETLPNISRDMDIYSYRLPLGVTAGITPFNFPAMIPMWVSHVSLRLHCGLDSWDENDPVDVLW